MPKPAEMASLFDGWKIADVSAVIIGAILFNASQMVAPHGACAVLVHDGSPLRPEPG
jgi:hypothetical protein